MAARTLGWAQRRAAQVTTPTVPNFSLNAIAGTSVSPVTDTLASNQAGFEVTAGVSVSIRWGSSTTFPSSGASNTTSVYLALFYETGQTLFDGGTDTVSIVNTSGSAPVNVSCHDHQSATGTVTAIDRTFTFTPTHTGTIRAFARGASWVTATNTILEDINTDGANFSSHAETFAATSQALDFTPGLWRWGTTLSSFTVNGTSGSPNAAYGDTINVTIVTGAAPATADGTYTTSYRNATPTQFKTGTIAAGTTTSASDTGHAVDNSYPITLTSVGVKVTPANSGLSSALSGSALPWVHWTTVPSTPGTVTSTSDSGGNKIDVTFSGAYSADPRLTHQIYMQLNTTTLNTPPDGVTDLSHNVTAKLGSDVGEVTHRVKNARSEGQNGISYASGAITLTDVNALVAARVRAGNTLSTSTLSGAAGWLVGSGGLGGASPNFLAWPDSLPSGTWHYNYVITTPAGAIGLETPATPQNLTLLAPNPAIVPIVSIKNLTNTGHHIRAGDICTIAGSLDNVFLKMLIVPTNPTVALFRFEASLDRWEYFRPTTNAWVAATGTLSLFDTTTTPALVATGDGLGYKITFTAAQTALWTVYGMLVQFKGEDSNGTPYQVIQRLINVANANEHDQWVLDPIGLALSGVFSQR